MLGNSATILQFVLTGLVLCAAGLDMRWRIIPNWLTLAIALIAPLYWLASGLAFWPAIAWQMLVGFACFGLFALAFAANSRCACCACRLRLDGTRALGPTEHALGRAQRRLRCCQPRNWHAIGRGRDIIETDALTKGN